MSVQDPDKSSIDPEDLYRSLPMEQPPVELDRKILAHAAERSPNKSPAFRWDQFGRRFAAAAVVVLTVGIFLQIGGPVEDLRTEPLPQATNSDPSADAIRPQEQEEEAVIKPAAPKRTRMMLEERELGLAKDEPLRQAPLIEEVMVADAAGQFSSARAPAPATLTMTPCNTDETCSYKALHHSCREAFLVPADAAEVEVEEETIVFTSQNQDHFVRCLEGSWTTQSQDIP